MEQLRRSYTYEGERPEVFELKEAADIKAWLEPCVTSCKNITAAHQYTIEAKEIDGVTNAVTRVKQYARCSDEKWMTAGVLLQVGSHVHCIRPFVYFVRAFEFPAQCSSAMLTDVLFRVLPTVTSG